MARLGDAEGRPALRTYAAPAASSAPGALGPGKIAVASRAHPPPSPSGGTATGVAERPLRDAVPSSREDALAFAAGEGVPADPAAWPRAWGERVTKSSPAPVLWTYHELGADLAGIGKCPARSAFFREIIGELRLPRGTSVFWPCAMPESEMAHAAGDAPEEGPLLPNPALFAAGVARLRPQVLVVFGERAMADMGFERRFEYFHQYMVGGKLLVLLPDIEALLHGKAQRASAVSLLRAVITPTVYA